MLGDSGNNNPDRIMMVWSSVVVVYKNLIWEITIAGNRKTMDCQGFSFGETILHGSHVHLHILQVMPRMQYSLSRPFLRVVFAATKLEEWGYISLWNKEQVSLLMIKWRVLQIQCSLPHHKPTIYLAFTWVPLHCSHRTWKQGENNVYMLAQAASYAWIVMSLIQETHVFCQYPWNSKRLNNYDLISRIKINSQFLQWQGATIWIH